MPRPALELADIFRHSTFARKHPLPKQQSRVIDAISACRTAVLGSHVDECGQCGHIRISYNSCRNRHCPKCQSLARAQWVEARKTELLPVEYFHVVFTLPEEIACHCRGDAVVYRRAGATKGTFAVQWIEKL